MAPTNLRMTKKIISILIVVWGSVLQAQNAFYFGPQLELGTLTSSSTAIRPDINPAGALKRNPSLPQWSAGLVLGGVVKNNDLSVSVSYRQQYLNHTDPNAQLFTNSTHVYLYKAQLSGLSTQLKYLRNIPLKDGLSFCGGAGLQLNSFQETTITTPIEAQGYDADVLRFEHTMSIKNMAVGIAPELGFKYQLSKKINLYLYGRYAIGTNEYINGKVDRIVMNSNRIDQGQYSSKGSSASAGLSLQFTFVKDEQAATERMIAKDQRRREKARQDSLKNAQVQNDLEAKAREQRTKDSLDRASNDPSTIKEVKYDSLGIPTTLDNRTIDKQNEVTVNGLDIELIVWDDKQEDGDSISLYLNGEWILEKYRIQTKKKSIKITLDPNRDNYLIMYALNEGRMPPNTCAIALNDGTGSRKLNLKSTMKSCAALHFKVKK